MTVGDTLTFGLVLAAFMSFAVSHGNASRKPDTTPRSRDTVGEGGLQSVLDSTVSPAFGATIIIILMVIVSGSAYLCFLKYVCAGCCRTAQVVPSDHLDPSKAEEQV